MVTIAWSYVVLLLNGYAHQRAKCIFPSHSFTDNSDDIGAALVDLKERLLSNSLRNAEIDADKDGG